MSDPDRPTIRRTVRTAVQTVTVYVSHNERGALATLELVDGSSFDVTSTVGEHVVAAFRHAADNTDDLESLDGTRLPRSTPPPVVHLAVEDDGGTPPVRHVVGVRVGEGPWFTNRVLDDVVRGGGR